MHGLQNGFSNFVCHCGFVAEFLLLCILDVIVPSFSPASPYGGIYKYANISKGRPYYTRTDQLLHLYWTGNRQHWMIGSNFTLHLGWILSQDNAVTPELVNQTSWKYWGGGIWNAAPNISVVCAETCTNMNINARSNCGELGITKTSCISKGCCYDDQVNGVPWCYHKVPFVDCGTVPEVEHSSIFPADYESYYGTIVIYSCHSNYVLVGNGSAVLCEANEEWSQAPSCVSAVSTSRTTEAHTDYTTTNQSTMRTTDDHTDYTTTDQSTMRTTDDHTDYITTDHSTMQTIPRQTDESTQQTQTIDSTTTKVDTMSTTSLPFIIMFNTTVPVAELYVRAKPIEYEAEDAQGASAIGSIWLSVLIMLILMIILLDSLSIYRDIKRAKRHLKTGCWDAFCSYNK
ncbi:unnamed protein product [Owenia fusiformis]|uniref:Uncharacterized protein n=1 Tax=Owenia fusiformis TaxID=6347 RepID=A0A8J1TWY9_OWEFU|nr:unnamed protein product [Owenia fusiformis]